MMNAFVVVSAALLAIPIGSVTAQQPALGGYVFVDANGNGRRDPGESGVAGVVVSDQVNVVRTGSDGSFSLGSGGLGVAFVSIPDGYRASGPWWKAAAQLGDGFGLARAAASADFTFLHASDTHVSEPSVARIRRLGALVDSLKPDFVLITGDLVRDALRVGEAEARGYYELFGRETAAFASPVWTVPGNHEVFGIERHLSLVSPKHPLYGRAMYRHYRGPDYYSFNRGGIHFVGLNTVDVDDLWYYGHVDSLQLAWLERDLAAVPEGTPVVTFNHIPFYSTAEQLEGVQEGGAAPTLMRQGGRTLFRHVVTDADHVLAVLATRDHRLALGGHIHHVERLEREREGRPLRFSTAAAVVAPVNSAGQVFPSGVTLYRVRGGVIDAGTFVRMDPVPTPSTR